MYKIIILILLFINGCLTTKHLKHEEIEDMCNRRMLTITAARCSKQHSESCCPNVSLYNGTLSQNYHLGKCGPFKAESCKAGYYLENDSVARCPIGYYCPKNTECVIPCSAGSYCPEHKAYKLIVINNETKCSNPLLSTEFFNTPVYVSDIPTCPGDSRFRYCPEGFYCPKPWIIKECPPGKKCLKGFSFPLRCNMFGDCKFLDNADAESLIGIILLVVLAFVVIMALFVRFRLGNCSLVLREEVACYLRDEVQSDEENQRSPANQRSLAEQSSPVNQSPIFDRKVSRTQSARKSRKSRSHFNIPSALWSSLKVDITGYRESLPKIKSAFTIHTEDFTFTLKSGVKLLRGVDVTFQHSKVNVVMGPSGCGKSTLIRSIMGYNKDYGETSGTLYLNGVPVPNLSKIKTYVGYLTQHDIMNENLTVKEILTYQAQLKLPEEDKTNEYVTSSVTEVINLLALNQIGDRVVGHLDDNLISGGQRRRLSIGESFYHFFFF